ncbi:uncharacterized protein LOC143185219 [Calliopsis andreniformis]|uniref:uncharacterized protein LOC143185219 n=1 Tax=Calliopsis andreniformis TaxID=337506 RepID=UPI003FCEB987
MEISNSMTTDTVEIIRDNLREIASKERKEHRTKVLNKNRVALGNIVPDSSFTTEFVIKKAKALKNKSLSIEEYKQLQNALIQSEENVNSFLKVDHILFSLVRDFSGNDPVLQLYAINCCCNIALGNSKACTSLTKSIAPYLITELESLNYPLLEVCIWTIGNLVAGSSKAFEVLHAQDCLKYIISLMHDCDNIILPSVAYSAMHYIHSGCEYILKDKLVELVKATTERQLSFEHPYFIWLLALLSSENLCISYLHNVVHLIVEYLYQNFKNNSSAVKEITACIRVLANTICETSGQLAKFLLENPKYEKSELKALLNTLLSCQYMHIRKETLWLIGNLYNHTCFDIRKIIQDLMPQLFLKEAVVSITQ